MQADREALLALADKIALHCKDARDCANADDESICASGISFLSYALEDIATAIRALANQEPSNG